MLPLHISILFYSFFFSQHCPRAISLLKRTHFLVPSDICPFQFPISLLYFSLHFCYFLMMFSWENFFFFFFDNIKVLFHVKDHQSFQVSLLLKIGTNWCYGRVVIFCSQRGSNWEDFFSFEVPEWLMRWVQKSWFLHRSFQIL